MGWFDGGNLSFETWNDPSFSNYAPIEYQPEPPPQPWEQQFQIQGGNMFGEGNRQSPTLQFMPGSLGAPGAQTPQGGGTGPQPPSLLQQLIGGGLGAAPGVAGLIAALTAGNTQNYTGRQNPQQVAAYQALQPGAQTLFNSGAGLLGQLGQGANPLQTQQNSILGALAPQAANLASGNVQIPESLRALVKQAYDPYVGDIASQAIESARNRGFAGGAELLNTGPAGAIAGPALSNAAGMQANSLLQAMLAFPQASANIAGAYNQPVNQLANIGQASMNPAFGVASGYNGGNSYEMSGTSGAQAANSASQALAGGLQGAAMPGQQYQNQQQFQKMLDAFSKQNNPQSYNGGSLY